MLLIESRDERFVNEVGEQNSLWYRVSVQRRRLRCRKSASFNGFLRRRGRLCFYDIGLREFSGLVGMTQCHQSLWHPPERRSRMPQIVLTGPFPSPLKDLREKERRRNF